MVALASPDRPHPSFRRKPESRTPGPKPLSRTAQWPGSSPSVRLGPINLSARPQASPSVRPEALEGGTGSRACPQGDRKAPNMSFPRPTLSFRGACDEESKTACPQPVSAPQEPPRLRPSVPIPQPVIPAQAGILNPCPQPVSPPQEPPRLRPSVPIPQPVIPAQAGILNPCPQPVSPPNRPSPQSAIPAHDPASIPSVHLPLSFRAQPRNLKPLPTTPRSPEPSSRPPTRYSRAIGNLAPAFVTAAAQLHRGGGLPDQARAECHKPRVDP